MDFSLICRTCLGVEHLNPIFTNNDDCDRFTTAIDIATGVKVLYKDNLPQNMCTVCINMLNDILKFRKQCRESNLSLLMQAKTRSNVIKKKKRKNTKITPNNLLSDLKLTNSNKTSLKAEIKTELLESVSYEESSEKTLEASIENGVNNISVKNISDVDDLPLNLLLPINTSDVKDNDLEDQVVDYDETEYQIFDEQKYDNELHESEIDTELPIDINSTVILSECEIKNNYNEDLKNDSIPSTVIIDVDAPYELLIDSTTEKVCKVLCKLCNKKLSIRSIDLHMARRHPGADKRKVKCELCETYVMRNKLNRHMKLMHGNESFRCGYCKSEFSNKQELVEHVGICTAKKRKRKSNESGRELGECDECHKVMQKASLRMHKAVKHAGLRPVCEHCGKSFGNKFRLSEHYRAKHDYEKFQCKYCEFRSASTMAMRNHERRHRNEKPFACDECGAKFHAAYLLAQHRQSHRTERLVQCELCPASFKANYSLHMHKLTCHSSSNYTCMICNRSYKCRHYAVKHLRHVHRYLGPNPPLRVLRNGEVEDKPP